MIGSFEYGGVESRDFDLISKSVNRPILPELRTRAVEIFGKHGVIDYGSNNYTTRQITMHIAYVGTDYIELRQRAREIANWLISTEWKRLIINDEPDKYYLARVYSAIDFETLQRLGECDIVFECQPFALMVVSTGEDLTWDEADFPWITDTYWDMDNIYTIEATGATSLEFNNPSTCSVGQDSPQGSKFDIIITGSWTDINLTLNNKTLEYTEDDSGTLIINNVDMEVELDGVNKLDAIDGDIDSFLSVISGTNTLYIDGTDLDISVKVDFTPMWL